MIVRLETKGVYISLLTTARMFDECPSCGGVRTDMVVDPAESEVICPNCAHRESIHREPLLIVSGASGTGKSAVLRKLRGTRDDVVFLDSDVLWREGLQNEWYFRTWLRLCRDIAQSNRPPVLFGAGFGVPENLEPHSQYDCFSTVQYLVLVCDEMEQERRLQARPPERYPDGVMVDNTITEQIEFNQWLKDATDRDEFLPIDTTDISTDATAKRVNQWISDHIKT